MERALSGLSINLKYLFFNGIPKIPFIYDLNNLAEYPKGENKISVKEFYGIAANSPFPLGFLVSFIWRNVEGGDNMIKQIVFAYEGTAIKQRSYREGEWAEWQTLHE